MTSKVIQCILNVYSDIDVSKNSEQSLMFIHMQAKDLMYRKVISQDKVQMLLRVLDKCIRIDSKKKKMSLARPFWYSLRTVS